jgi:hypothetical protein
MVLTFIQWQGTPDRLLWQPREFTSCLAWCFFRQRRESGVGALADWCKYFWWTIIWHSPWTYKRNVVKASPFRMSATWQVGTGNLYEINRKSWWKTWTYVTATATLGSQYPKLNQFTRRFLWHRGCRDHPQNSIHNTLVLNVNYVYR